MENKKEMRSWLNKFKLSHPLVIAGPCSAETENQVLKILKKIGSLEPSKWECLIPLLIILLKT